MSLSLMLVRFIQKCHEQEHGFSIKSRGFITSGIQMHRSVNMNVFGINAKNDF